MWRRAAVGWLLALAAVSGAAQTGGAGWPTYGGDAGGQRYSTATEISRDNVMRLHPVWTYHTHALDSRRPGTYSASFETTPVLFRGLLYLTTPFDEIVALNPATGVERWRYQPPLQELREGDLVTSRGVATWDGGGEGACATRVFVGTNDGKLWAVDAASGQLCDGFGVIVTAGGLVFSAGTREPLLRAYDAVSGKELWKGDLPAPAQATPMTYQVKGRQFVVIAAGGSGLWGTEQGDAVVAFGVE